MQIGDTVYYFDNDQIQEAILNGIGQNNYMLTYKECDFLHNKNYELETTSEKLMEKFMKNFKEQKSKNKSK